VNWSIHPWTVQFLEYDITTFNIAFPISYTLQVSLTVEFRGCRSEAEGTGA